ncbi:hypothetical protein AK812_SmicGene35742 [Symbiodinium microadriaticum]|uniref:Reverse transcriptase domain-containing protein n=1 Tax=Symbiodinium microadriaticum TaxID=2951 RepID=A0A1Q9CKM7_SYMMI|nr:hypothetical protein AK812_SmicGene35742 [Symbiodinium microadriaticum]
MSITESEARAQKLGLSADVLQLVVDGGVNTLAKFAYVSSFIPGQSDETPFVTALKELLKRDATVGELSVFRRLHSESYALVAAELKAQVERTTDAPARSLAAPDRADLLARQDDETRNSRDKEDRTLTVDNSGNVHIKNADIKGEDLPLNRYREVPAGYVRVSIQQLLQVTAAGRPLDAVWMRLVKSSPLATKVFIRNLDARLKTELRNCCSRILLGRADVRDGQVWVERDGGDSVFDFQGTLRRGVDLSLDGSHAVFSARRLVHATRPWSGCRLVLVAFSISAVHGLSADHMATLRRLEFHVPSETEILNAEHSAAVCYTVPIVRDTAATATDEFPKTSALPPEPPMQIDSSGSAPSGPLGLGGCSGGSGSPAGASPERGFVLEIFARTGALSREFHQLGFEVMPIDKGAHRLPLAKLCSLDLALASSWQYLTHVLDQFPVRYIHVELPYATFGPTQGLRQLVSGVPVHSDNGDASIGSRLALADSLLSHVVNFLRVASVKSIIWTLEHPHSSFLWSMPEVRLLQVMPTTSVVYDLCNFGTPHRLRRQFLTTCKELASLNQTCQGNHPHVPIASGVETHPKSLCRQVAAAVAKCLGVATDDPGPAPAPPPVAQQRRGKAPANLLPEFGLVKLCVSTFLPEDLEWPDTDWTAEDFANACKFIRPALLGKVRDGFLEGPLTEDELDRRDYVSNGGAQTTMQHIPTASRSQHKSHKSGSRFSLRALSWNCGGLSNLKDELHTWLKEHGSDFHVVMLQETWYRADMDFLDRGWICINSGIGEGAARAHAGVMVLLRRDIFDQSHVRFHSVVPGRLLHVQALCKGGWVNVINIYQYSWGLATDEAKLLTKRAAIWDKVRATLGQIPKGNFLLVGGDLNTACKASLPWLGRGMLQKDQASPDSECLEQLLQDFSLCAVNTFGRPTAFTYVHEGYKVPRKSFVDFVLIRKTQSGTSSATLLPKFEVGRWREGGRHLPVQVTVTLRPYLYQVRKAPREWPVWKCKLLQQVVKTQPELAAQYQEQVQEQLEAEIAYTPQQLNQLLLQVGKQVFDIQRPRAQPPAWASAEHTSLIKQMWTHYRLMKRRRSLPGTRAVLHAWRHQVAFLRMHKVVQKHSRRLRRERFDQLLVEAERCDQADGASATFSLIKKWAPKQARKRTQLRAASGRLLCPAEEVKELATFWKDICAGEDGRAPRSQQPRHAYHVTREELVYALRSLKGSKAAPAHCAPHVMWHIAAEPIATHLEEQVLTRWGQETAEVFEEWSDSWLTFLNKPHKVGNKPSDLRPISLLEPAGKAMSGIVKQHLMPFLQPWIEARNLFGYLPNRSAQQALCIVFQHCADVRERAKAQGRDLYAIRRGQHRGGCAGGLQVSIDFTQAFDRVNRDLLHSALLLMRVPEDLRCLIMQWVESTTFHVTQDDAEAEFSSTRGIRQGCRLSPSLWVCVSVFLLHLIEQEMGPTWCNNHLVGFADDTHLRWDVTEAAHLHQAMEQAHRVLQLLERVGLQLSRDKTVCLLRLEGVQAPTIKRKITEMTKDGRVLKLSAEYTLPLKQEHVYLGACITYDDLEHKNMKHRVHAGKVAFQRVRKFLMAEKAATLQKRLRLWQAIVIPTVMYSITASGVLPKGFELLRVMLTKQARAIARSPRHRMGGEQGDEVITESDEAFWNKVGLAPPAKLVQQRLEATIARTSQLGKVLSTEDAIDAFNQPAPQQYMFVTFVMLSSVSTTTSKPSVLQRIREGVGNFQTSG